MPAWEGSTPRNRSRDSRIQPWRSSSGRAHIRDRRRRSSRSVCWSRSPNRQKYQSECCGHERRRRRLAVDQETIERRADPARSSRCPFRFGVDGIAERVVAAAIEPGPVEITFDAEHEPVVLRVVADLAAADEAVLAEGVVASTEGIAPCCLLYTSPS